VTSGVRDAEASSEYIFQSRFHKSDTSVNYNSRDINTNIIISVQVFIKLLFRHLELLDSLG
jgi:hypothetical protein